MTFCRYTYKWQLRTVKAVEGLTVLMVAVGFGISGILLIYGQHPQYDQFSIFSFELLSIMSSWLSMASVVLIPAYFIACYKSPSLCFIIEEVPNKLFLLSNYLLSVIVMGSVLWLLIIWQCRWTYVFPEYVQPVLILLLPFFIHAIVFKRPLPDSRMLYTAYAVAGCCTFLSAFYVAVRVVHFQLLIDKINSTDSLQCNQMKINSIRNFLFSNCYVLFYASATVQLSIIALNTSHDMLTRLQELMQWDNNNATEPVSLKTIGWRQQRKNALRMVRNHWIASLLSVTIFVTAIVCLLVRLLPNLSVFVRILLSIWPIPMAMITIFYWMKMDSWRPAIAIGWGTDRIIIVAGCACELVWSTCLIILSTSLKNRNAYTVSTVAIMLTNMIQAFSQCIIASEILQRKMEIRNIRNPLANKNNSIDGSVRKLTENQWEDLAAPCLFLCSMNAYYIINNSILINYASFSYISNDGIRAGLYLIFWPLRMLFRWHAVTYFIGVFLNAANQSVEDHAASSSGLLSVTCSDLRN